jgi:hypothetical protein
VNQRTVALEKKRLKKSRGHLGTRPSMHKILFHVAREQPTGVTTSKIEKDI